MCGNNNNNNNIIIVFFLHIAFSEYFCTVAVAGLLDISLCENSINQLNASSFSTGVLGIFSAFFSGIIRLDSSVRRTIAQSIPHTVVQ